MNKIQAKQILPYFLALICFYALTLIYFQEELINGKSLPQTDVMQFQGMSKNSVDYHKEHGESALWNDGMFSGLPDYLIATGIPDGPMSFIVLATRGFMDGDTSAQLLFVSFLSFYLLLLCFRVNPYLAIVGALAFGLNSYNIVNIEAGHITKTWAIAYSAIVLGGMHLLFRKKYLWGFALTTIGLTLQLRPPHYQITYYLIFVCAIFTISELIFALREKRLNEFVKTGSILLLAVVLGGATATCRIWITKEYTEYSIRGKAELTPLEGQTQGGEGLDKEYAFSWSQGKMETFTFLVPYLYGGGSTEKLKEGTEMYDKLVSMAGKERTNQLIKNNSIYMPYYHGDQPFTSGPLYAGAIICFLFVFALMILDNRSRYWMLGGVLLMMMVAWGKNLQFFNYFLFDFFPGYNKFRSVSMALSLALMLMPLAGMLAVQKILFEEVDKELWKKGITALAITGGLSLAFMIFGGMMDFSNSRDAGFAGQMVGDNPQLIKEITQAMEADRESLMRMDALRSLILILLAWVVLYFVYKKQLSSSLGVLVVGVLIVGDLWWVDKRYLYDAKFMKNPTRQIHQKTAADEAILKDKSHYRVLNFAGNTFTEANTSYYHKSIGGYFAAKMRRYQDLIERVLVPEQQKFYSSLQQNREITSLSELPVLKSPSQLPALNMLNAKYFKLGNDAKSVLVNTQTMGNAWFVESLKTVNSPDEEIAALAQFNPAQEAIMDVSQFEAGTQQFAKDSTASIELSDYSNRRLVYTTQNQNAGLAVFSEIYYPKGWSASIDGNPVDIKRVNYVLRALEIPAGNHEIVFEFNPTSYEVGSTITLITSYLVFLTLVGVIALATYRSFTGKKQESLKEASSV
ncbi:YfhO family protein [Rapidithrix thailandica]|uniref:YfhO family protein n=1 Tax=Rapidithrix thailandica TaxID=413964 RepID=A0AAW9S4M0_9BACT